MALTQCFRVSVTLNPSAVAEDRIMNVWHFATRDAADDNTAFDAATAALNTFYQSVDQYLSSELDGAVPDMYGYNYIEVKPRQPFDYFQATALTAGSNRGPREIAACVSYKAQYVSGVTPRRRRGRIYLGPLSSSAIYNVTGMIDPNCVTALNNAADALVTASAASTTWAWVVYSPTSDPTGTGEVGMYEVVGGWVDNMPDIQRRRGVRSGTRSNFAP